MTKGGTVEAVPSFLILRPMQPTARACRLAQIELSRVTKTNPNEWLCSTDPVTGTGDEFFFRYRDEPSRFVYVCVEDGRVSSTETNYFPNGVDAD